MHLMNRMPSILIFKRVCLLALTLAGLFSMPPARVSGAKSYFEGEKQITLGLKAGKRIDRINNTYGTYIVARIPRTNHYLLGVYPGIYAATCLNRLHSDIDVEFADWNHKLRPPEIRQVSQAFID